MATSTAANRPRKPRKDMVSEELQAEADAARKDEYLVYDPTTDVPIAEWIDTHRPSKTSRTDHIGRIVVYSSNPSDQDDGKDGGEECKVNELKTKWEERIKSRRRITIKTVAELAKQCNLTSGKWLFHVATGAEVDRLWKAVAQGVVEGTIDATHAKVTTYNPNEVTSEGKAREHAVCIHNNDFTNKVEVAKIEDQLRSVGVQHKLCYKTDACTKLDIYPKNKWGIRPSIYISYYNKEKGTSTVKWEDKI